MTLELTLPRLSTTDAARIRAAQDYLADAQRLATGGDAVDDAAAAAIRHVGVVGAGTMGAGIAQVFLVAGFRVTLMDADAGALARARERISRACERMVSRGRLEAAACTQILARLDTASALEALADCDLVIEAVFENMAVKRDLIARLGAVCKPEALLATNTSSLDVNALALASGRPARFAGMHFFSPVHAMRLLEIVRGEQTAQSVLDTVMAIARRLGKVAVVSGVCFGFIGNRMLEGYLREAEALLLEGATPSMIDGAIEAVGMAMGPCRMIDLAGVDVAAGVVLEWRKSGDGPADPAYRIVVRSLFEHGRLGQKAGKGYYRYEGRDAVEDEEVLALCEALAAEHGIARREDISAQEIAERCLFPLINEGARIVEEGIAARAGDLDVVWVHGYGFPAGLGGPMYWGSQIGAAALVARLDHWAALTGNRMGQWDVSPWLRERAAAGRALVP